MERAIKISVGVEKPLLLYLSDYEAAYWSAVILYTILGIILNLKFLEYPPTSPAIERLIIMTAANFFWAGIGTVAFTFLYLILGKIDIWTAASRIASSFIEAAGISIETINSWLDTLSWWDLLIYGTLFTVSIIGTILEIVASGGAAFAYKVVEVLGKVFLYGSSLFVIGLGLRYDWEDGDSEVG